MREQRISILMVLMLVTLIGFGMPMLNASELNYEQYEMEKKSELNLDKDTQENIMLRSAAEGEATYDDEITTVDGHQLNIFSYAVYHEGYWYSPFYYQNSTGNGITLPSYLDYINETVESIDGKQYYTYQFQGDDVTAQIVIHLENNELVFEIKFQNDSTDSVNTSTSVDFDTCISQSSVSDGDECDEDYVPLYSQGQQKGIYMNSEDYDVNFYVNYLGSNTPDVSKAYPWVSEPYVTPNQINSAQDELLLEGRDTAIFFKWDDSIEPGESITYSFSIGISKGVFVPVERPTINASDSKETPEEKPLSDQELLNLFAVSASSAAGVNISSNVSVNQSAVDYSKPGVYPVVFTINDGGESATKTSNLTITDTLPVINTNVSTFSIELGATIEDPIQKYEVTATEITSGDLTSRILVDMSQIDYATTGTYPILFTVVDEEGNEDEKEVELVIERPIVNITDDLTPTVDVLSTLEGRNEAQSNEETNLTDEQLIELFEVVNSDSLEISVDQSSVDYTTPGDYQVIFSDTDGNNFVGTLKVLDILPQISSDIDTVTILVGSKLEDVSSQLTIVATEITEGDLTAKVIFDDSKINYNLPGKYDLVLNVQDEEGNIASKVIEVVVEDKEEVVVEDKDVDEETKSEPMVVEESNELATTGGSISKSLFILLVAGFVLLTIKYVLNAKNE